MAVYQKQICRLTLRNRGQAPSHSKAVLIGGEFEDGVLGVGLSWVQAS